MTTDQALPLTHPDDISAAGAIPLEDDAPRVFVRPSLNRDFASLMMLLFIVIAYHIQHPTLLIRSQFGRSFRDESLQEGIAVGLVISFVFMIGSFRKLWDERSTPQGRLRLALIGASGLFVLYFLGFIFQGTNIIHSLYDVSPDILENVFEAAELADLMKVTNGAALLGGAAIASVFFLWSPWEIAQGEPDTSVMVQSAGAILALIFIWITYHFTNPLLAERYTIVEPFGSRGSQLIAVVLLMMATAALAWQNGKTSVPRHARIAMLAVLGVYILYVLANVLGDYNIFLKYYHVTPESYAELLPDSALTSTLLALDRAALFAGIALAASFFFWSPWENMKLYQDTVQRNVAPLIVAVCALILWEVLINFFDIETFLLPKPSVIWTELKDIYPRLIAAGWLTSLNAVKGFLVGCGAGILTGAASARFSKFSTAVLPLAIAANSIPIIAFAPVMNFWFGVTSPNSKVAIIAILCYFPAMISTVRGLTSVDTTQLELMRSYAASEMEIFRYLRVPNALPFIFSALKLATTLAMIGAIVSEFFGGSLSGLGYRIREDAALFRFPESWSAIIVASVFGISFYLLISALERAAMPWYQSFRSEM